jgi:integrase/recombinase XerD
MISDLFAQFIQEKRYISNLSPRTIESYNKDVFKRWMRYVGELPTKQNINQFVVKMRQAGLATSTCNITIRSFNSFLTWLHTNGHIPEPLRLQKLKEEKRVMKTLANNEVQAILGWKPDSRYEHRLYAILCTIADCGLRISEALSIKLADVDIENLLIKVTGKGSKERIVPMSIELRKTLFRYITKHRYSKFETPFLFCTGNGTKMGYNNVYRDTHAVLKTLGIEKAFDGFFHMWRRFYAKNYLRHGGNLAYLQQSLGHASITTTRMYVEVDTEDLQRTHLRTSVLNRLK